MASSQNANTQHARFLEAAKKLETNDDPAAFDALFGKLVPPVVPKPDDKPKDK